jgi:demethylmenaquinone methyltransferase/2-methoxy-6-polyprenyl-1,4-benzoquinol methylase
MNRRLTLKIGDHLGSAAKKKYFNEEMFSVIAPRYDFITRLFSFWQDKAWKRDLIAELPEKISPICLDLACGTGDIAFLLAEKYPTADVTGIDLTEDMLTLARQRSHYPNIHFIKGDMGQLEMAPETIDVVTGGYALRNAPDLKQAIAEIYRVLKPDGIAAFLDFSKPKAKWAQKLEYYILKGWTGLWGILLNGNHEVYSYIAESLNAFPNRQALKQMFEQEGFLILSSRLHFLGITENLIVQKK